jgi:hypothetical protein
MVMQQQEDSCKISDSIIASLHSHQWEHVLITQLMTVVDHLYLRFQGRFIIELVLYFHQKYETPKFIQLYIYDTSNEVRNRLSCLTVDETPAGCLSHL